MELVKVQDPCRLSAAGVASIGGNQRAAGDHPEKILAAAGIEHLASLEPGAPCLGDAVAEGFELTGPVRVAADEDLATELASQQQVVVGEVEAVRLRVELDRHA